MEWPRVIVMWHLIRGFKLFSLQFGSGSYLLKCIPAHYSDISSTVHYPVHGNTLYHNSDTLRYTPMVMHMYLSRWVSYILCTTIFIFACGGGTVFWLLLLCCRQRISFPFSYNCCFFCYIFWPEFWEVCLEGRGYQKIKTVYFYSKMEVLVVKSKYIFS